MRTFSSPTFLFRRARPLLVLMVCQLLLLTPSKGQEKEVPLTTGSREALAAYVAGRDRAEHQNFEKAKIYFSRAISKDPDFAMAYLHLAAVSPPFSQAYLTNIQKAAALADKASEGERLFILAAQAEGQVQKQQELLLKLRRMHPADNRVRLALTAFHVDCLDYPAAVAELTKSLETAPDFAPFHQLLGHAYTQMGHFKEAREALRSYQRLAPEEANTHLSLGRLLMKQGAYQDAIAAYGQALAMDSSFYGAYVGLIACHLLQDKPRKAHEQAQRLYDRAPNAEVRRQALDATVAIYLDEGKYAAALENAKELLAIAEKDGDPFAQSRDLTLLGNLYKVSGKLEEAQASYLRALKRIEQAATAQEVKSRARRNHLRQEAEVALEKKDLPTARQKTAAYHAQAEARNDRRELQEANFLRGMIALQEKQYETALQAFRKANRHNPLTLYRLGSTYEALQNHVQARLTWMTAAQYNEMQFDYLLIRRKVKI